MDTRFTPTQVKLLALFADGKPHSKSEIKECFGPCSWSNIKNQICLLRKKLRPNGEDIINTIVLRRTFYQHVRLLASANDGRK